jgi:hypothetical protein
MAVLLDSAVRCAQTNVKIAQMIAGVRSGDNRQTSEAAPSRFDATEDDPGLVLGNPNTPATGFLLSRWAKASHLELLRGSQSFDEDVHSGASAMRVIPHRSNR